MALKSVPFPPGTFSIGKTFTFEAGHRLPGLPPEHKCSRQHGHSYQVEVILSAPDLENPGFVTDFGDLAPFRTFLDSELDHHNLHELLPLEPTSERLASSDECPVGVAVPVAGRLEEMMVAKSEPKTVDPTPEGGGESEVA